jgi:cytochrome c
MLDSKGNTQIAVEMLYKPKRSCCLAREIRYKLGSMRRNYILLATTAFLLLGSCGGASQNEGEGSALTLLTATTLGEQQVLSTSEYLAQAPYAEADLENGERQAQICRACHSLGEGGANMIGPNLFGVFGTRAGTREGFDYSNVLRDTDFVWTPRALDAWLAQPGRFLPGNRMTFAGVGDTGNRADLIAFLLRSTSRENGDE